MPVVRCVIESNAVNWIW